MGDTVHLLPANYWPVAYIVLAYVLGSLPFAIIVSRLFGMQDPRQYGSGNPGATNVLRSGNKLAAILTLLGDAAKGWLAVWLAQHHEQDYSARLPSPPWVLLPCWAMFFRYSSVSKAAKAWLRPPAFFWGSVHYSLFAACSPGLSSRW